MKPRSARVAVAPIVPVPAAGPTATTAARPTGLPSGAPPGTRRHGLDDRLAQRVTQAVGWA